MVGLTCLARYLQLRDEPLGLGGARADPKLGGGGAASESMRAVELEESDKGCDDEEDEVPRTSEGAEKEREEDRGGRALT